MKGKLNSGGRFSGKYRGGHGGNAEDAEIIKQNSVSSAFPQSTPRYFPYDTHRRGVLFTNHPFTNDFIFYKKTLITTYNLLFVFQFKRML